MNIKYVDLNGLSIFAEELKKWLHNHVIESEGFGKLEEQIKSAVERIIELEGAKIYKIVEELPEKGLENTIYLLVNSEVSEGNLLEYIYIGDRWEELGGFSPELSLSEYLKIEDSPFEKGEGENSAVLKGGSNVANGVGSMALGSNTSAYGNYSHAEGTNTTASGMWSHAEGNNTTAKGNYSHAEGESAIKANIEEGDGVEDIKRKWSIDPFSLAYGNSSHAEGLSTLALGKYSHAEGVCSVASGTGAHAEGGSRSNSGRIINGGTASGLSAHAEGQNTTASGGAAHTEGSNTTASGGASHAEGEGTTAFGLASHAEGQNTTTAQLANGSHAEGSNTQTTNNSEHAEGMYNVSNSGTTPAENTIHSVGIGTSDTDRKNAHEIMQDGKHYIYGIGGYDGTNPTESDDLAKIINENTEANLSKLTNSYWIEQGFLEQPVVPQVRIPVVFYYTPDGVSSLPSEMEPIEVWRCNRLMSLSEAPIYVKMLGVFSVSGTDAAYLPASLVIDQNGIFLIWEDNKNRYELLINNVNTQPKITLKSDSAIIPIIYSELVSLRDSSKLAPGQQYRITDYVTTTAQANTKSANHQFDLIVTADDESTLNEKARAIQHEGDTYFANSNLAAWEIWYCLDNDTERFAWALTKERSIGVDMYDYIVTATLNGTFVYNDTTYARWDAVYRETEIYFLTPNEDVVIGSTPIMYNVSSTTGTEYGPIVSVTINENDGKGVIYRMIDEFNNDVPYDFKNIIYVVEVGFKYNQWGSDYQFGRNSAIDKEIDGVQYYGWTSGSTPSAWSEPNCWTTVDVPATDMTLYKTDGSTISYGGSILSINLEYSEKFTFNTDSADASLSWNDYTCYSNTIPTYSINGQLILNNITFGHFCYSNTFGNSCSENSFGDYCYSNSFGNGCASNSFGNSCDYNSFGNACQYNSFGNNCSNNSFGNGCTRNSFLDSCTNNSFGNGCASNSFGNSCDYNSFGNSCYSNSFGNNCDYNSFGNSCDYNSFGNSCSENSSRDHCQYNSFGNNCEGNSFGNSCHHNFLGRSPSTSSARSYCYYIHFDDGCSYNLIWNYSDVGSGYKLQNINVNRGVSGTNEHNYINITTLNQEYEIQVAKNSKGEIKIYCEAELESRIIELENIISQITIKE